MPSSSGGEHLKIYGCILQLFMISLWKKAWSFNFKLTISSLSPLCREHGSSFEKKIWIFFTQGCFVPSFDEIGTLLLQSVSLYICYFEIISPWKRAGFFICTNSHPHHPRIHCAKFGWNWPYGSWEEDENVKGLRTDGRRTTGDQKISS